MQGYRGGVSRTKGLLFDARTGPKPQHSRGGALAQHEMTIDKVRDPPWYTEIVTMLDTGEVIHHCDEPLSQHTGHGSNRRPPSGNSPTEPRGRDGKP
jgi:hypothetical protein